MSNESTILIIGAGIAGPVLAMFLKQEGYDPIIFEAHPSLEDAGLSLALQPNGLKVLGLIPGLLDRLPGVNLVGMQAISLVQERTLVRHDAFKKGGYVVRGVPRTGMHRVLVDMAQEKGIPIYWGHKLATFEQSDDQVCAVFENGERVSGSFAVGCDGLHSRSRSACFGREKASYLGMTQMGGWSPIPEAFRGDGPRLSQFFAEGAHMICYYCKDDTVSWAITQREEERRESWRSLDEDQVNAIKTGKLSLWPMGAGDLVRTAEKYVKYGLYDRPALSSWHQGRVVLVGDAAHPTSPHLGQGANQAFEDVYHLVRILKKRSISPKEPVATSTLEAIFQEYESIRIPRTTTLVEGARREGEKIRAVDGIEACIKRDSIVTEEQGEEAFLLRMKSYSSQPFDGASEI